MDQKMVRVRVLSLERRHSKKSPNSQLLLPGHPHVVEGLKEPTAGVEQIVIAVSEKVNHVNVFSSLTILELFSF